MVFLQHRTEKLLNNTNGENNNDELTIRFFAKVTRTHSKKPRHVQINLLVTPVLQKFKHAHRQHNGTELTSVQTFQRVEIVY